MSRRRGLIYLARTRVDSRVPFLRKVPRIVWTADEKMLPLVLADSNRVDVGDEVLNIDRAAQREGRRAVRSDAMREASTGERRGLSHAGLAG